MAYKEHLIGIPLVDRGVVEFFRPSGDGEGLDDSFRQISRAVRNDYVERRSAARGARREGANAWLMRVAYDLLLPMLEEDQLDLLIGWTERWGRYPRRGMPEGLSPMQIGLMALFAHAPKTISPQTRERLGKRLWHACRHYVPVAFLQGFVLQLESAGLESRVSQGAIEPGFEDWVATQRASDESFLDRGPYPSTINELTARLKSEGEQSDEAWDEDEEDAFEDFSMEDDDEP